MSDNLLIIFAMATVALSIYFFIQMLNAKKTNFPKGTVYQYLCFSISALLLAFIIYFKYLNGLTLTIVILVFMLGNYLFKLWK